MNLHQVLNVGAAVFSDEETDLQITWLVTWPITWPITWDGKIGFEIFAGKFNGDYDKSDSFYREVKTADAAKAAARMWFQEHATFNPGP